MAASHRNLRARQVAIVLALAWIVASLGWSWFVLRQSYSRVTQVRIATRAERLAEQLAQRIPPGQQFTDREQIRSLDFTPIFDAAMQHEPRMTYAMFWGPTGLVAGHTDSTFVARSLRPSEYLPLNRDERRRFVTREQGPFDLANREIYEITVPVTVDNATVGFLSVGYPQSWIDEEFWQTQRPLLYWSGILALVGVLIIVVVLAITERAIERSRQELETNARARTSLLTERGMLASVLAHEVRSPLTALRFNLHSLRNYILTEAGTEKQLELSDRCEREIRRLDLMLTDFLTRTQIIAPIMPTPINQVVNEALDFLRPALEQKNVRIVTHLDPANPKVAVNPDELRQVLLNLSANAQEAMPKGGSLSVSTLLDREASSFGGIGGGGVTLLFRDSGVGIPPELHTRIFEPFFTTKASGSGLGLALVRRVISGAGGTISCESVVGEGPGGGTTFRIVLPLATGNTPITPQPQEEAPDIVIDHTLADNDSK